MTSWRTVVVAAALGLASVGLLWTDAVPLGVPGEWTWDRLEYPPLELAWAIGVASLFGAIYLAVAWIEERGAGRASSLGMLFRLVVLVLAGMVWLGAIQSVSISGVGLGKGPFVLFSRASSGYFQQARYDVESTREFLAGYEESIAVRGAEVPSDIYLHLGTHPPGLTLIFRGLLRLCDRSPALVEALLAMQPEQVRLSFREITHLARLEGKSFEDSDAACLWLATLLVQLAAALTVVPLYLWLRVDQPREAAWRAAVLWPLVPAAAIFLPKSDVLFPLIGMTSAWLWRSGWVRGRMICCILSGTVLFSGMLLSLAFLPVAAWMGVQTLCDGWPRRSETSPVSQTISRWRLSLILIAAGAAGFVFPGLILKLATGFDILGVWWWNYHNHALFYEHFTRTAWKWWLVNPLELSLAVGLPVMVVFVSRLMNGRRRYRISRDLPGLAAAIVWGLLWLSGKNMGEAARLWIFLIPWFVAGCAPVPATSGPDVSIDDAQAESLRRRWKLLTLLQLAVCAATVLRIDAFAFGGLLQSAAR